MNINDSKKNLKFQKTYFVNSFGDRVMNFLCRIELYFFFVFSLSSFLNSVINSWRDCCEFFFFFGLNLSSFVDSVMNFRRYCCFLYFFFALSFEWFKVKCLFICVLKMQVLKMKIKFFSPVKLIYSLISSFSNYLTFN